MTTEAKSNHSLNGNVNFRSGVADQLHEIPMDLGEPIFACGRVPGWMPLNDS